jgi:hypothetical protein
MYLMLIIIVICIAIVFCSSEGLAVQTGRATGGTVELTP